MTEKEIKAAAKLTEQEQQAVNHFVAAAKALPKSICLELSDYDDGNDGLEIHKRITKGSSQVVARIRKKSLIF
jgi:hypothetical protein